MDLVIKTEPEHLGDSKTILFENLQAECNNDQAFGAIQVGKDNSKVENQNRDLDQDGNYQCDNCPELFEAAELYEIHRYIHNPGGSCPHCKRSYKNAKPFREHIKGHIRNHIKCNYCPKIFFMKKTYICHIAQHKKVDRIFSCNYCEKKFSTSKQLTNHTRVHTNERPYQCGQCDKSFKQNGSLKTHMNTHMEEKMYTCDVCQGTFATTSSLKRHEKRIHATGRSMLCKLCDEEFLNLDSFYQHRMEKHPDFKRYFRICSICSEEFLSRHVYLGHRKMHISNGELEEPKVVAEAVADEDSQDKQTKINGEKMQKCVLCGMLLVPNDYYTHQNVHLEMTMEEVTECKKKFKFKCKKCDAVLSTKHRAFKHMDVHLDKIYFCSIKDCIRKKPMTYMTYTKHRNYNHKYVKCRNCKATFPNYSAFKRHRTANPCKTKTPRKKTYMCKFCKSTFNNQQFLLLHYKTHRRTNSYNCHTCNKKFPRFVNFRKHMFVVHSKQIDAGNTSPYRLEPDLPKQSSPEKFYCLLCKEAFQSKQSYSEHETMHYKSKFQCKKCGKLFVRQTNYWYHVENKLCANWLREAMLDKITDFKCRTCEKELSNLRNLARHMTNVHGSGDYRCKHCVAQFNSVEKFRSHLVIKHPDEKKYFCTMCERVGFVTFKEFIDHRREHKRRHHIKHVVCKVTMDDLEQCTKTVDVKEEMVSEGEEEGDVFDVPEIVEVSENGDIRESV